MKRGYLLLFAGLFVLLFFSTIWLSWFRSLGGVTAPLSPTEAADAHYLRMRQDLLRDNDLRQITGDLRPKLWLHIDRSRNTRDWAGTTFRTNCALNKPYQRACLRSIRRHNAKDFRIMYIDDRAFQHLVPDWPWGDLAKLGETERNNMRTVGQLHLLYLFGGLIVPTSFWCRRPLRPLFDEAFASGGNDATPFCVSLPAATAARPLLRDASLQEGILEDDAHRPAGPQQLVFTTYTPDTSKLCLAFFGCRPHCAQVRRLIDQVMFQSSAVNESAELAFHGSNVPQRSLCAGRWTAVPLVPDSEAAAKGSSFLAPPPTNVHQAPVARLRAPSSSNPPSGVRRVGLQLQRTNGPWRDLPGMPLVQAEVRGVSAGYVGRVDCRGDTVTLAQLLGMTPVQFREEAYGVWIPEDELSASYFYAWFPGMGLQAMKDKKFVLAGLLSNEIADIDVDEAWGEEIGTTAADAVNPFSAAMDMTAVAATK